MLQRQATKDVLLRQAMETAVEGHIIPDHQLATIRRHVQEAKDILGKGGEAITEAQSTSLSSLGAAEAGGRRSERYQGASARELLRDSDRASQRATLCAVDDTGTTRPPNYPAATQGQGIAPSLSHSSHPMPAMSMAHGSRLRPVQGSQVHLQQPQVRKGPGASAIRPHRNRAVEALKSHNVAGRSETPLRTHRTQLSKKTIAALVAEIDRKCAAQGSTQ